MKNRIIMILTFLIILFLCLLATVSQNHFSNTIHQHIANKNHPVCQDGENDFCTHLPIVKIDTNNQSIPGEERDGSTITTTLEIIDNKETVNHQNDQATITSSAKIRYRGNSSMKFNKKGYLIKLVDENGLEQEEKMLGMDYHSEWVLHGPYLDKTLIRNYMWYNIGHEIMGAAPQTRFCEVFVDGEYKGVYVMVESPARGDTSRMKISKYKQGDPFTSYIVRLDKEPTNELEQLETFSGYSYNRNMQLETIYPGKNVLTPKLKNYIENDISKFEKALYSYDYDSAKHGYRNYINVDSFVDYFIINEFTLNYDAGNLSTYLYKDVKGKLNLYIWDFNSANDNYKREQDYEDFEFPWNTWYYMLLKDEKFVNQVITRYKELRRTYLSDDYLMQYIDETVAYLGKTVDRNFEKWGFLPEEALVSPMERNPSNYKEAIEQLKNSIKKRGKWLDENIEILKQFSHESKVKKFNH